MIVFTPDGKKVLVANEGEPNDDYTIDPEGSVSIIDLARGVTRIQQGDVVTADFKQFNNVKLDPTIRIFGPKAKVAQDLEPEYITVSKDSQQAWATLQENNAVAHLDIGRASFTKLIGLGVKDHSLPGNELDASDRDGTINIVNWPIKAFYLPDAVASYEFSGKTYLITANEGDTRDYDGYSEEERVSSLALDPVKFPNAADLQQNAKLGRLTVTSANGKTRSESSKKSTPPARARFRSGTSAANRFSIAAPISNGLSPIVFLTTSTRITKPTTSIRGATTKGRSPRASRSRAFSTRSMPLSPWNALAAS
jgi:DNA-binding beta-propeller fold protein YncE